MIPINITGLNKNIPNYYKDTCLNLKEYNKVVQAGFSENYYTASPSQSITRYSGERDAGTFLTLKNY